MRSDRAITIGALSDRARCDIETIRYYERVGIMPNPPRTKGGHRLYSDDHVKRLVFVRRCRELGFHLNQVRGLLQFVDSGEYTCGDVREVALEHLGEIRQKIADLRKLERVLKSMAAECDDGNVPECAIIEALFREKT